MTVKTKEKRETHTPGPWKIKNGKNYYHIHGEQEVALVENWMNETPRANARLIAAAPEMHRLLERIANDDLGLVENAVECAMDARDILAKVEGGGS